MKDYEPSLQVRVAIVEDQMRRVRNTIYDLTIQRRVAKMVDNSAGVDALDKQLASMEKQTDALRQIMSELQGPPEKKTGRVQKDAA